MQKNPLIVFSIAVTCVFVLASYTNVVGVQTVKTSNNKLINSEVDQKELLFQTILDIANNKKIQKIIFNSEIRTKGIFEHGMIFSVFTRKIVTMNFLKHLYTMGVVLTKTISKSKIQSILERYKVSSQDVQKGITSVIEKDSTLAAEINRLSRSTCDCENENTTRWSFPVLCILLIPFVYLSAILYLHHIIFLFEIMANIGSELNCFWQ